MTRPSRVTNVDVAAAEVAEAHVEYFTFPTVAPQKPIGYLLCTCGRMDGDLCGQRGYRRESTAVRSSSSSTSSALVNEVKTGLVVWMGVVVESARTTSALSRQKLPMRRQSGSRDRVEWIVRRAIVQ